MQGHLFLPHNRRVRTCKGSCSTYIIGAITHARAVLLDLVWALVMAALHDELGRTPVRTFIVPVFKNSLTGLQLSSTQS